MAIEYSVVGDNVAPYYFRLDPQTGVITVRQDLRSDNLNMNYVVNVIYIMLLFINYANVLILFFFSKSFLATANGIWIW